MRKFLFHPALLALALYACTFVSTYEHVERVVRNDAGAFTIYVRDGSAQLHSVYLSTADGGRAHVVADVPSGQPMWAEVVRHGGCVERGEVGESVRIHVRSLADLEEAGRVPEAR